MDDAHRQHLRMINVRWLASIAEAGYNDDMAFPNSAYLRDIIVAEYGFIPHVPRFMLANGEISFFRGERKSVPNSRNIIPQNYDYATPLVMRNDIDGDVYWFVYNNLNHASIIDHQGNTHSIQLRDLIVIPDDVNLVIQRNLNA